MSVFPSAADWRAACRNDPVLSVWAGQWSVCFAIESDGVTVSFDFVDGCVQAGEGAPLFRLAAPAAIWEKFLRPVPPRHHHGIFAMMYRVPEFQIEGETVAFMQHAHLARRVLDIGKWLALGHTGPAPATLAPRGGATPNAHRDGRLCPGHRGRHDVSNLLRNGGRGAATCCACTPPEPTDGNSMG